MSRDGYYRSIAELRSCWRHTTLRVFNLTRKAADSSKILRFIEMRPKNRVYRLVTNANREIVATEDHPILTPQGMKPLRDVEVGDMVAVHPFEGVEYQEPGGYVILDENDFNVNVARELKKRKLLPLRMKDERIGMLARIVGYVLGDGTIHSYYEHRGGKRPRRRYVTVIYGEREGLEDLREDVEALGFKPSKVYSRRRAVRVKTAYGAYDTVGSEHLIKIYSNSFSLLINRLGIPIGRKTEKRLRVPSWILRAPLWVKRNFLAGLFGADLSKPLTYSSHPYNFQQPALTVVSKSEEGAKAFLNDVKGLLEEFGVKTLMIYRIPAINGNTALRLVISNAEEDLVKLWLKIGYEYNRVKSFLACLAGEYLRLKRGHKAELKNRSKPIRFPKFKKFVNNVKGVFGSSGALYEVVRVKEEVKNYGNLVYDFTVDHKDHNFVANGFIVSNCGVRLVKTNLDEGDVRPVLKQLIATLFRNIPCGLGSRRRDFRVTGGSIDELMSEGARWVVRRGLGWDEDIEYCEENGGIRGADPTKVSHTARRRGAAQIGTLGSGNHFIEIDVVDRIEDPETAKVFGIDHEGQVLVLIHTGSRGFGHQICSDYLRVMERAMRKYGIHPPDRELACAPATSREAQGYIAAMKCAVNYAFANRQAIMHWARESFSQVFKTDPEDLDMHLIYDVAHNIAKLEEHVVDGEGAKRMVYVHRKGATRAFPPGRPEVPAKYRNVGQPVLIPGSMADSSWVLVGTRKAMELTFGSTAHGAGRLLSRAKAKRMWRGSEIKREMERKGILVEAASLRVLSEEASGAYKPCDLVAEVSHQLGIATKVARLVPIAVAKG